MEWIMSTDQIHRLLVPLKRKKNSNNNDNKKAIKNNEAATFRLSTILEVSFFLYFLHFFIASTDIRSKKAKKKRLCVCASLADVVAEATNKDGEKKKT